MSTDKQIVERDLAILEEMVLELPEYMMSESTHWIMAKGDMPKLTIGGCLMRLQRLPVVRDKLDEGQQKRLDIVTGQFNKLIEDQVVRLEHRTHQELRARLGDWSGYLRDLTSRIVADVNYYASVVDTRLVMTAMLDKLETPPYQLDEKIVEELKVMDGNLRGRWQPGDFVWPAVWEPAYDGEKHWWLYGQPAIHEH